MIAAPFKVAGGAEMLGIFGIADGAHVASTSTNKLTATGAAVSCSACSR